MKSLRIALAGLALTLNCWADRPFPPPDVTINQTRPQVGYNFGGFVRNPELWIDGQNYTQFAQKRSNEIELSPTFDFTPGVHNVQAKGLNILGLPIGRSWSFTVQNQQQPVVGNVVPVSNLSPGSEAVVDQVRPRISAQYNGDIRAARLSVDGRDVTPTTYVNGNRMNADIPFDLAAGRHNLAATVTFLNGANYSHNWSFVVSPAITATQELQPDGLTDQARPRVQVVYNADLRQVRLSVDGRDITDHTYANGNRMWADIPFDLSPGKHTFSASATGLSGATYNHSWSCEVRAASTPAASVFSNLTPAPGAQDNNLQPTVSADLAPGMTYPRLFIDQSDVTGQSQVNGSRLSWRSSTPMSPGTHSARLEARQQNGQVASQDWQFTLQAGSSTTPPPNVDYTFSVDDPLTGDTVDPVFDVGGTAKPGSLVRITVRPLPKKNKVVQFKGYADRAGHFYIPVSASWAPKKQRLEVTVIVVDAKTGKKLEGPEVLEVYRK
jgi:hypothetical protein